MTTHEGHQTSEESIETRFLAAFEGPLLELATTPGMTEEDTVAIEAFLADHTKKLPRNHQWMYGVFSRVCQDLRLTHEEADTLAEKFLY